MNLVKIGAIVYCFMGLLMLTFALSSDIWITKVDRHFGLWVSCKRKRCGPLGKRADGYIVGTRIFFLIAALLSFVSLFGTFVSLQFPHIGSESLAKLLSQLSFVAGFFAMIAMTIFTGAGQRYTIHGWKFATGYFVGWISGPLFFISAAIGSLISIP